jgi:hypothetical protein
VTSSDQDSKGRDAGHGGSHDGEIRRQKEQQDSGKTRGIEKGNKESEAEEIESIFNGFG